MTSPLKQWMGILNATGSGIPRREIILFLEVLWPNILRLTFSTFRLFTFRVDSALGWKMKPEHINVRFVVGKKPLIYGVERTWNFKMTWHTNCRVCEPQSVPSSESKAREEKSVHKVVSKVEGSAQLNRLVSSFSSYEWYERIVNLFQWWEQHQSENEWTSN